MNIIYFTQFYPPENIAAAFRARDHAYYWSKKDNQITVFTGYPNYPTGKIFDGYDVSSMQVSNDKGIRLIRSRLIAVANTNFIRRIINGVSFSFFGALNIIFSKKKIGNNHEVVIATSGPVFTAYLGALYAKKNKLPLVVEYRDLSYAQLIATGSSQIGLKVRLMKMLEVKAAKKADAVVVLTQGFKDLLEQEGIPEEKIFVIPNGADLHLTEGEIQEDSCVRLGYFGTMGLSQDICRTLDIVAALAMVQKINIKYTLIGEGAERKTTEQALENNEYEFAELLHGMSQDELEKYYAKCDFTIVSLKNSESFSTTIPSKIFQSFARGVPVIFIGPEGEAADLILQSRAGIVLCGTTEENKEKLIKFFLDEDYHDEVKKMRENAIGIMVEKYSREKLADNMLQVVKKTAEGSRACG